VGASSHDGGHVTWPKRYSATMSKAVLLIVVASLGVLAYKHFRASEPEELAVVERKYEKPANTTGAAPSPGNDPNMHNSPTRRLGF
jgi:hypothetical protein